ncbi:hypothetical protein NC652_010792 [Populus alba x Populus x berolinensis]|nr:hypothetical protein NC652_010792 [Populus alba x Populus x berolinensis]
MCGFNSSTFIDLCKHVFQYKGNEFRILAMSTIMAKPKCKCKSLPFSYL